jgi:hypothetical protein
VDWKCVRGAKVLFTHWQTLAWVDMAAINHKYPVSMTYNRLHHRAMEATQTSALSQEKATIRFRQQIVNIKVITLGLKIARMSQCL